MVKLCKLWSTTTRKLENTDKIFNWNLGKIPWIIELPKEKHHQKISRYPSKILLAISSLFSLIIEFFCQ